MVVARQTGRKAVRSGVLWGYVFGVYVASRALGYTSTYKTQAQRTHFAATFGSNAAINALTGPAHQIQTVAGFTARCRAQAIHASTDARVTVPRPGNALAQNATKRASARSSLTYL